MKIDFDDLDENMKSYIFKILAKAHVKKEWIKLINIRSIYCGFRYYIKTKALFIIADYDILANMINFNIAKKGMNIPKWLYSRRDFVDSENYFIKVG